MHGGSSLFEGSTGIWLVRATGFLIDACEAPRSLLEELEQTGGAPQLPAAPPSPDARAYVLRLEHSKLSVMCEALATEAAVNAYVHAKRPAYHAILEKLTTLERLALAPRLLSQSDLFPPGSRVYEEIERLFALRDALVHPWPRARTLDDGIDGGMGERFNPRVACELLETVSRMAKVLGDLYEHPYRPAPALGLRAAALLANRAAAATALPAPTVSELAEEERLAEAAFVEDMIGA